MTKNPYCNTMERKKYLIVIGGPTASGKTELAIQLAKHFRTEILSCDSRQFYREMSIGTAKPTKEELAQTKHHFIDSLSIHDNYTVGDYEKEALKTLRSIYFENDFAILAGGSGLYIKAVCEGLDDFPSVPDYVSRSVKTLYGLGGIEALQKEVKEKDPIYFSEVDIRNHRRLIRALSVIRTTGRPFSSFRKGEKKARPFIPIYINLKLERGLLYLRINQRVDEMIRHGLVREARKYFPFRHLNAMQTVGYKELFANFNQEITMDRAVELIKQNTRRYAKRQGTWFRKQDHWKSFKPGDVEGVIEYINSFSL